MVRRYTYGSEFLDPYAGRSIFYYGVSCLMCLTPILSSAYFLVLLTALDLDPLRAAFRYQKKKFSMM